MKVRHCLERARPAKLGAALLGVAMLAGACTASRATPTENGGVGTDHATATLPSDLKPVQGGQLVFGLEAETLGWNPVINTWAQSGHEVGLAIFDPLAAYDADGNVQPYLADAFEHNMDFTEWTIRLRGGVTFHDGTSCNAAAVKQALDAFRTSLLTASVFESVADVRATDDLTLTLTMSKPWASFPATLATQAGYIAAPAQLAAAGEAKLNKPIGTGPFRFESWTPGTELVVTRNPSYWRTGLPYLNQITFKPVTDPANRASALAAGDLDMIQTSDATSIVALRESAAEGKIQIANDTGEQEEYLLMLNNSAPPFDDPRARKALAAATDVDKYLDLIGAGITESADGPFVKTSKWYAEHGYPVFDLETAKALVQEFVAAKGELRFRLGSFADTTSQQTAQALAEMYRAAGMQVEIDSVEQQALGIKALSGDYQALIWRQFSAPDPDGDFVWWHSGSGVPGTINLNFARMQNPAIDAALEDGRKTDDFETRKKAYARLQQQFAETVPYVWLGHTTWSVAAGLNVRGLTNGTLPDGAPSMPFGGQMSGYNRLAETWIAP